MVYFKSDNIISSLGFTTKENFNSMLADKIGIVSINDPQYYLQRFFASMIDETRLNNEFDIIAKKYSNSNSFTKLEKMLILSVCNALSKTNIDITSSRTGIILSTTKGNINLLSNNEKENYEHNRVLLWKLGEIIQNFFSNPNKVIVISNACISGVLAINTAAMHIESGQFDNVVVTGGDIVSRFVVSGFMSFMSLSPTACKPFDKGRDGLSLGEAAGTVILSKFPDKAKQTLNIKVVLQLMMLIIFQDRHVQAKDHISPLIKLYFRQRSHLMKLITFRHTEQQHHTMMKWRVLLLRGMDWKMLRSTA